MTDKSKRKHEGRIEQARQLRQPQTPAEGKLWAHLRGRRLSGLKFRRQHPIGSYIVDFYCPECRLVVEINGDVHAGQQERDSERTAWLQAVGCRVVRFTNRDVCNQLQAVLETILRECEETE